MPVNFIYSDDTGDTITTTTVGPAVGDSGGDVDDFNLGVAIVAANKAIHYTTDYDGAFSALSGLTGLDGTALVTCVRVPYRKLATQALNNDKTSLQFIFSTDRTVSGKTLWGVAFNANTGAIIAQSDMTPIIGGVTYCVIGPRALETYGGNTRIARAWVRPNGGGSVRLIQTTNGGTSWTSVNTGFDGSDVFHFPPDLGGNGSRLIVGGEDGISFSGNGGTSLSSRDGDFASETGSAEVDGIFAL